MVCLSYRLLLEVPSRMIVWLECYKRIEITVVSKSLHRLIFRRDIYLYRTRYRAFQLD